MAIVRALLVQERESAKKSFPEGAYVSRLLPVIHSLAQRICDGIWRFRYIATVDPRQTARNRTFGGLHKP
jgi:hypothetical protein